LLMKQLNKSAALLRDFLTVVEFALSRKRDHCLL
jgi:hypothetical protein